MTAIQDFALPLPHGITLRCRAAGEPGRPVLLFVHGFPEAAFVWDPLLHHFSQPQHGGFRCIAPNMRGYERSTQPGDVAAYRPKHLVQDLLALIAAETGQAQGAVHGLIAHDWGGAVAWNLANQHPDRLDRLCIINSPHPGTFLRELQHSEAQRAASAYMNFLIRPDAALLLAQDDYRRLWAFFTGMGGASWLTDAVKDRYRTVWQQGLDGALNYYRASPLRPPTAADPGAMAVTLPEQMLRVLCPTQVIWGMNDIALQPSLLDGLESYIPSLRIDRVPQASHWIIHEQPALVADLLGAHLLSL